MPVRTGTGQKNNRKSFFKWDDETSSAQNGSDN